MDACLDRLSKTEMRVGKSSVKIGVVQSKGELGGGVGTQRMKGNYP